MHLNFNGYAMLCFGVDLDMRHFKSILSLFVWVHTTYFLMGAKRWLKVFASVFPYFDLFPLSNFPVLFFFSRFVRHL